MKTISVKLPNELALKLEKEAENENKSSIVREALEFYFQTLKNRKKTKTSFFALSSDLCGCIVAPTDLATNPKYLEEYGE